LCGSLPLSGLPKQEVSIIRVDNEIWKDFNIFLGGFLYKILKTTFSI